MEASVDKKKNKLIPREAWMFVPKDEQFMATTKDKIRIMFGGDIKFSDEEKAMIEKFKDEVKDKPEAESLKDPFWTDANILKFYIANKCDTAKTLPCIVSHTQWRKDWLPAKSNDRIQDILKQGFAYISGRDNRFRPIIVIAVGKINSLGVMCLIILAKSSGNTRVARLLLRIRT